MYFSDPSYSNSTRRAHTEHKHLSVTFVIVLLVFIVSWTPLFCYMNYASLVGDKSSIPTLINPIGKPDIMHLVGTYFVIWFNYVVSG